MTEQTTAQRRPYRKPELTKVKLRPEEAVLGNCKTGSVAGPLNMCGADVCFDSGS